ncbi:MAG: S1 RNA-binding domain-containing protein [Endomicrobia bacterium]|nr:S1 RNA-binding domain-containing protein [Endomicrobiia bacterium]
MSIEEREEYTEETIFENDYKFIDKINVGDIVEGKIIDVTNKGIYVDIGLKTDGFVPVEELGKNKDLNKVFKPNQTVKVFIVKIDYNDLHIYQLRKLKK